MDELVQQMKIVLANTFAFYLKAHNYHWNVEGPDFAQYHDFLGDLYAEVFGSVDKIAEHIRILNSYAPGSFSRFLELSTVQDELAIPMPVAMMNRLVMDNQIVIDSLVRANQLAERENKVGTANFLQDRIDVHEKHGWMLRSFIKV